MSAGPSRSLPTARSLEALLQRPDLSEPAHDPARSAGPRRNAQWLPRCFRDDEATSPFRSGRPNPVTRPRCCPRLLRSGEGAKALMRRPVGFAWICARGHLRRERQGRAPPGLEVFALDPACERIRAKACRCYKRRQQVFVLACRVGGAHYARPLKPNGCQLRTMIPWGHQRARRVSNQEPCLSTIGMAHALVINSLS
jgi:hypothetical protein